MSLPQIYFEKLLESSPDIVVAVDRAGVIVFYNDGARQTLGYASSEVLGKPVDRLYPTREHAKSVMHAMRGDEYGSRGKVKNFETLFLSKDREQIPVAISGSIIYDDAGQEMGSIGFAKELREIRRRDRLMTLGEIAVSLAHEINNPLEVLTNTGRLLEEFMRTVASDEQMIVEGERFDTIERELGKIQGIVNRVQGLAAGDAYETRQYLPGTLMTDLSGKDTHAAPPAAAVTEEDHPDLASLAGREILVVDDDLGVCQSIAELLRHQSCTVAIAGSAREALGLIDAHPFDLVLSDVVMPDMDGYDLYMDLRDRHPELPVVLMTSYLYDRDHVIKRSKLAGLDDGVLFKKPIDPERLTAIVRSHCAAVTGIAGEARVPGRIPPAS
jgi:PAS domain S-box-containing protein